MNTNFAIWVLTTACVAFVYCTTVSSMVAQICEEAGDCEPHECCVEHIAGLGKICRAIGTKAGDPCGGNYFCTACSGHMECTPSVQPHEDHDFFGLFGKCTVPERKKTCQTAFADLEEQKQST